MAMLVWSLAAMSACLYCIARGILDLRQGKYVWGIAGIVSALIIMLTPLPTHAVKVDLPINTVR